LAPPLLLFFLNPALFGLQDLPQLKPPRRLIQQTADDWQMILAGRHDLNI
jgi:hypothetical protein